MSDGYNGWSNYETWLVNLWMTNDKATNDYFADVARDALADSMDKRERLALPADKASAVSAIEDCIREWVEDQIESAESGQAGLVSDLLGAAVANVDFRELATNLYDAYSE